MQLIQLHIVMYIITTIICIAVLAVLSYVTNVTYNTEINKINRFFSENCERTYLTIEYPILRPISRCLSRCLVGSRRHVISLLFRSRKVSGSWPGNMWYKAKASTVAGHSKVSIVVSLFVIINWLKFIIYSFSHNLFFFLHFPFFFVWFGIKLKALINVRVLQCCDIG